MPLRGIACGVAKTTSYSQRHVLKVKSYGVGLAWNNYLVKTSIRISQISSQDSVLTLIVNTIISLDLKPIIYCRPSLSV